MQNRIEIFKQMLEVEPENSMVMFGLAKEYEKIGANDEIIEILEKYLGRKITLIPCAGGERISSEREQWNDGTNTLCIAPGVVVVYDRNNMTNNILREHGIKVLEMPSAELSRGRGGPRCMSMPLIMEEI